MISFTEKAVNKIMSIMNEQKVTEDTRLIVGVGVNMSLWVV